MLLRSRSAFIPWAGATSYSAFTALLTIWPGAVLSRLCRAIASFSMTIVSASLASAKILPTKSLAEFGTFCPGLGSCSIEEGEIGRTCGALPKATETQDSPGELRPFWLIVDPTLHVLANIPIGSEPHHHQAVLDQVKALPAPRAFAGFEMPIPVLVLPNVFDQALCRHLVSLYDQNGGSESGIYRNGAGVNDHSFKRRKDFTIEDQNVIRHLQGIIARRVSPEIERLFFHQDYAYGAIHHRLLCGRGWRSFPPASRQRDLG